MDLFDSVMGGIVRAGREAGRVRFIGEVQARLVALRLARRGQRDAVANEVMELYRRDAIRHPSLTPLCRQLDATDAEIERLEAALARARGNEASHPASPIVTEITTREHPSGNQSGESSSGT
jgi:hypothetical protein